MQAYSVQKFRNGYAIVYYVDGKRHREKLDATDRESANAEARIRWRLGGDACHSVGSVIQAYLVDREQEGIVSLRRRQDAWKAMKTFWEKVDPILIDKQMCKAYAAQRKASISTTRYELNMLSVALRWANSAGLISKAPAIWRPTPPPHVERHLSREEFEIFLKSIKAPHAKLYAICGIATMARPAALLELTWDRVDFDRGEIDLNPRGRVQTSKRRPKVPINSEALDALRTAYEARQCEYVIEHGGKPIKSIKKAFQAAAKRSELQVTPYTLRHTGAVWAAEAGVPMPELAQFMGHDVNRRGTGDRDRRAMGDHGDWAQSCRGVTAEGVAWRRRPTA